MRSWLTKTISCLLAVMMLTGTAAVDVQAAGPVGAGTVQAASSGPVSSELHGVWISYLEWNKLPTEVNAFRKAVDQMMDNCVSLGMNAVFVHARSHGDAMYPSSYFPWSKMVSGQQGKNPGYDPFAYMIEAAHARNLEFHAWVNPYRVTGYLNQWSDVSSSNQAKKWLTDSDTSNDRWVLKQDGEYYYNPSIPQVRKLIEDGIQEIIDKYDVDGIHFDDYFYPSLDNNDANRWFDKPEYDASGSSKTISVWRRDNVNTLVREIYQLVKAKNGKIQFGISPAGYVKNLRSDAAYFCDIDTWMSQSGYIDYIMPQLYWGFECRTSAGQLADYAYTQNLNTWVNLKKQGPVKLYLGLIADRAGKDIKDNNAVSEWLSHDDILKRQVLAARGTGQVSGFSFFSYSSFYEDTAKKEVENLKSVLK